MLSLALDVTWDDGGRGRICTALALFALPRTCTVRNRTLALVALLSIRVLES
jgi:hypothetical protein